MAVVNVSTFGAWEHKNALGNYEEIGERLGVELLAGPWICRWLVDPAGEVTAKETGGRAVVRA